MESALWLFATSSIDPSTISRSRKLVEKSQVRRDLVALCREMSPPHLFKEGLRCLVEMQCENEAHGLGNEMLLLLAHLPGAKLGPLACLHVTQDRFLPRILRMRSKKWLGEEVFAAGMSGVHQHGHLLCHV